MQDAVKTSTNQCYGKRKVKTEEIPQIVKTVRDPFTVCLICHETIKVNYVEDERRQLGDIKFHYTKCYFDEGKFSSLFTEEIQDPGLRQFRCPHDDCTKRIMTAKDFSSHMGLAHRKTLQVMSRDQRQGFEELFYRIFPIEKYLGSVKSEEVQSANNEQEGQVFKKRRIVKKDDIEVVDVKTEPVGNNTELSRKPVTEHYGKNIEPSKKKTECSRIESNDEVKIEPTLISLEDEDEDYVDDKSVQEISLKPFVNPRVDKVHQCVLCKARGKRKEGRTLNLGEGLQDLKYHYAICFYAKHKFKDFVDSGPYNRDEKGFPLEDAGARFKYKCPFETCAKNSGRSARKLMGFKEYSIHCAVVHHVLETVLEKDETAGVEEVRAALMMARMEKKVSLVPLPPVECEEVHVCLLCNGQNRDSKTLNFSKPKISSLKYHYASCYFDTGVYYKKYPPGPENEDLEGKPCDVLGRSVKYHCQVRNCSTMSKRKMGYKEFCIHMSNDHGGLLEVMAEDKRPELREIGKRLSELLY